MQQRIETVRNQRRILIRQGLVRPNQFLKILIIVLGLMEKNPGFMSLGIGFARSSRDGLSPIVIQIRAV